MFFAGCENGCEKVVYLSPRACRESCSTYTISSVRDKYNSLEQLVLVYVLSSGHKLTDPFFSVSSTWLSTFFLVLLALPVQATSVV